MKIKLSIASAVCLLSLLFTSCQKEKPENESTAVTLNVTIAATDTYKLDLSQYGDADDLTTIITQATAFNISEINKDNITSKYIYSYSVSPTPKTGFNGTDKVILKIYEPAGRKHYDETVITINFIIQ